MGISNRDYYRSETGREPYWMSGYPGCRGLIIANCVVFVAQLLLGDPTGLAPSLVDQWFALDPDAVKQGQIWRLLSYAFLHDRGDLLHLLFNMWTLWWAGRSIEPLYGHREFLWFYTVAALIGGVGFAIWGWTLGLNGSVVGASGAVMAVLMLFARHYPHERISIFGLISIEAQWLVAIFAIFDLYPVLVSIGDGFRHGDRVAHIVHLSGLAFGWLYFQQGWRLSSGWVRLSDEMSVRWRRASSGRNFKVYQPQPDDEPENLEAEVDRILAKIHDHGSESLTDRERSLLTRASEHYKRRD